MPATISYDSPQPHMNLGRRNEFKRTFTIPHCVLALHVTMQEFCSGVYVTEFRGAVFITFSLLASDKLKVCRYDNVVNTFIFNATVCNLNLYTL